MANNSDLVQRLATGSTDDASLLMDALAEILRLREGKSYMRKWRDEWARRESKERALADSLSEYVQHSIKCDHSPCSCGLFDVIRAWEARRS